jgi:O-antigen/teichoic acid export membrane protein
LYVLPLFTTPVVTRAFGTELFGFVATSTAAAAYVSLVVWFGFPWSAPRLVAQKREDLHHLSQDVSAILASQLLIALPCALVYLLWTLQLNEEANLRLAQWLILAAAVPTALVPSWLFLGLERMRDLVIPQFLVRTGATIAIVAFVRNRNDLVLYTAINAIAALIGLILFLRLMSHAGVRLSVPSFSLMRSRIRESSTLFVSNAAISFYTTANILVVSFVLGNAAAGIFGLADRIRQVAVGVFVPITQAIYPFVCRTVDSDDAGVRLARRRLFQLTMAMGVAVGLAMLILAPYAVAFLGGSAFGEATLLVRLFAAVPVLVALSNLLGIQTMLPLGLDKQLTIIVVGAAVLGIGLQFLLTRTTALPGSAAAYVITEVFVCGAMALALWGKAGRRSSVAMPESEAGQAAVRAQNEL